MGEIKGVQMADMNCWLIYQNKVLSFLEWDKLSQNSFLVSSLAPTKQNA